MYQQVADEKFLLSEFPFQSWEEKKSGEAISGSVATSL
jgi:hypothetical protein